MFTGNYYARQNMGADSGAQPFGAVIPPMVETWPADGLADDGENARSVVDSMVGTPKAPNVADGFGLIFDKLASNPANADLIGQLEGLRLAIIARLDEQLAARLADLQTRHSETYAGCRAALDKRDDLQNRLNGLDAHVNAAGERLSRARAAWQAARQRRPQNYPTWAEITAWKGEVAQAQARVDTEQKAYDAILAEQADLARQLVEANKEFERVTAEEAMLKARLEGKPYADPAAFGLIRPPEVEFAHGAGSVS